MWFPYQLMQEKQNKQYEHWPEGGDLFLEYAQRGIACACDLPQKIRLHSGRTAVFMIQHGPWPIKKAMVVAGYKATGNGILNKLKGRTIEIIPEKNRDEVESQILSKLNIPYNYYDFVSFWDAHEGD